MYAGPGLGKCITFTEFFFCVDGRLPVGIMSVAKKKRGKYSTTHLSRIISEEYLERYLSYATYLRVICYQKSDI